MLVEYPKVRQEGGANRRRWFQDDGMDFIVWYDPAGPPKGFQICYQGMDRQERALTWRTGRGFSHARVDSGDLRPDKNLTPILVKDGAVPWAFVRDEFVRRGAGLVPALRDLVLGALGPKVD